MKSLKHVILALMAAPVLALADPSATTTGWTYTEVARFKAAEARQGVAVDADSIFVISNHDLGKYDKVTHERLATWSCPEGEPLTHVNAGLVYKGRLYGAHSNFPGVPHASSVEIWDARTLKHVDSISLGRTDGSLTWFDRRDGKWIVCFVHYGRKGGEPGKGPEWTRLVEYDDDWRETGRGWVFPSALMERLGARGFSVSGGAMAPDGHLLVSGHDDKILYVLKFPESGPALEWIGAIPVSAQGQAFAWDTDGSGKLYNVMKETREVIIGQMTHE